MECIEKPMQIIYLLFGLLLAETTRAQIGGKPAAPGPQRM